jgi:protein O-mannosyl-transferase
MSKKIAKKKKVEAKVFKHKLWLVVLIVLTFITFTPSLQNGFVNWDDDWFIQENPQVLELSVESLPTLFGEYYKGQYAPVTTLFLGLEYHLSGGKPFLLHLFSLLFHLINILLVFLIVDTLVKHKKIALLTAALFALHPLQAESIGWISAQKVVLYTLFFLLSLWNYIKYVKSEFNLSYLLLSLLFFVLAFLSKEQAVTLALSVVGIDYLLQRNLISRKVLLEKIPFFAFAIVMGLITIQASKTGEFFQADKSFPLYQQIAYSCYAFVLYITELVIPYKLSAFHPYPVENYEFFPSWLYLFILPVLALIYLFFKLFNKNRLFVFGLFFFVANMILVLQLMPLRDFIMADRYIYIPAIGILLFFSHYLIHTMDKKNSMLSRGIIAISIIIFTLMSFNRVKVWKDSYTLFTDVTVKYPESSVGWNNRGLASANLNKHDQAVQDYKNALQFNSNSLFVYNNLGISLGKLGRLQEAIQVLSDAINREPKFAQAYFNLADAKSKNNDPEGAIKDYTSFLELKPDYTPAYVSRGILLAKTGALEEALSDLNIAISQQPNNMQGYLNRGVIYLNMKSYQNAVKDFSTTLRLKPNFDYAYFNRGIAKASMGDQAGGCVDLQKAAGLGFKQANAALQRFCQ